jgi:hypothetical protein
MGRTMTLMPQICKFPFCPARLKTISPLKLMCTTLAATRRIH